MEEQFTARQKLIRAFLLLSASQENLSFDYLAFESKRPLFKNSSWPIEIVN